MPSYAAWNAYGVGDGGAAIYNDNGTYKKLMVVGNSSAGGSREVGIWDNLTVNGKVTATQYCIGASCITSWTSGSISGSGTAGKIPRFTSATALGDSSISSDGASATVTGNMFITGVLYDGNDVNYYLNSNSTSNLNIVYANSFLYTSDERLKENIVPLSDNLETLSQISGVSFTWKAGTPKAGQDDIGVIAQDVEKVVPEAVHTDAEGMKSVDYARLVPLLISAVNDQQKEINELKADIAELTKAK